MRNSGLEEAQTGIKIARRNINNLRHADDTTLMVESEEELKNLLMKVKDEEKGTMEDEMDMSLSKLQELVVDREAWQAVVCEAAELTELNWTGNY